MISIRTLLTRAIPLLCVITYIYTISADFLVFFYTLPNIFGHDSSAHFAAISIYKTHTFPALWGWISEWYTGMPFPLFYPPLPHYLSSFFFSNTTSANIIIFKVISHIFVLGNIILLYFLLTSFFKDELAQRKVLILKHYKHEWSILQNLRVQSPILIALATVFLLNQGAPSFNSLIDGLYSHQFAMFWFTLTVWSFLKNTRFSLIVGSLSVAILLLSNIHAFLTACIVLPFIVLLNGVYSHQKINLVARIWKEIYRSVFFFTIGILITMCWSLSMWFYYAYFAGIHTIETGLSKEFISYAWPILIIVLVSVFISIKTKNVQQLKISLPVTGAFSILFIVDILQRANISIHLPIQLWRWYETLFVLTIFPLTYLLFILMKRYVHVGIMILLILSVYTISREKYLNCCVYFGYMSDNVPKLIESQRQPDLLTFVHGRASPQYTTLRQMTIDSDFAIAGIHTIFSTFRESSINAIFLRMTKQMVSPVEENWALINFIQSRNSNRHIDTYYPLLQFLGINKIVFGNSDINKVSDSISVASTTLYTTTEPTPAFTVLESKNPQSRATQIKAPLTLIFAENGFRDRTISDPTYTRFQEIAFEKKLYSKSITFSPHTLTIEENVEEINKAKYIVFANLETKNITKAIEVIENSLIHPDRKIFILANKDYADEYREFVKKFARHKQVVFVDVRNNIFPFDEVISNIIASEPFEYREDPLSVEMSNTNINISKQGKYTPSQSQHLTQTVWFIRQSYFPAWIATAQDGTRLPTYLASPGYTLVFPDKNTSISLHFSTPYIVIIGHVISLLGLITLLAVTLYQYRIHQRTFKKRENKR